MDKFIVNSTASLPLGLPTGSKCLMVKSGQHVNRMTVVYAASATTIAMIWADPPYNAFSSPVNIVTDSADSPFDAWMNDTGDIYIAYSTASGNQLAFVKLTFNDGVWSVGTPVTVYDSDANFYPSIRLLSSGYLWISYTRVSGGSYYISAKSSGDDGQSWGTVSNPGDTLTTGSSAAYSTMVEAGDYQYVFYTEGGAKVAYRRKLIAGVIWNSEVILASGSGYGEDISVAVAGDGRIGLAYSSASGLKFREYSGSAWSAVFVPDENAISGPAVSYPGGVPYVLYIRTCGTNMKQVMYTRKTDAIFQNPAPLDNRKSFLTRLLVYDASAGTYQDKSEEAASADTADIFHTTSGKLLAASGDAFFLGMDQPFHFLNLILSTVGSGGEVVWKYWDGQAWKSFTPASGSWHFSSTQKELLLWDDYHSIPADWQKKTVAEHNLYWISVTVASPFTGAPIGTQISAVSNLKALSIQV